MADSLILESTSFVLLEDGTSHILTEGNFVVFDPAAGFPYPTYPDFARAAPQPLENRKGGLTYVPATKINALRWGNTDHDGVYSTQPVDPNLYTIAYFIRNRVTHIGTGVQYAVSSIETDQLGTAGGAHYNLVNESTFNANTIESHDDTQGGFLIGPTMTFGKDSWWFAAETNNTAGPATTLYVQRADAGAGNALTPITGNTHPAWSGATRYIIGTDDAAGAPGSPQNEWFDGDIIGIKVWNAELSQSELELEKLQLSPVRTANLWAYYDFQDLSTMLIDKSGNGRNLQSIAGQFSFPAGTPGWTLGTKDGPTIPLGPFFAASLQPYPRAPDFVPTQKVSVAAMTAGMVGPINFGSAPPPFDPSGGFPWEQAPDILRKRTPLPVDGITEPIQFTSAAFDPSTGFPWDQLPDVIRIVPRALNTGGSFHELLDYGPAPKWYPDYPDFPARGALRPVNTGGSFHQLLDYGPRPTWLPDYPDFAGRGVLRPVDRGGLYWVNLEYEPTDWFPYFQDIVWAAKRPVNTGGSFHELLDYGPVPAWLPDYPDFARAALRPVNTGGAFQQLLDYGPIPKWYPDYPDFARIKTPNVNVGWFSLVIQEREPITDWLPDFPDFPGRAPLRPLNTGGYASFVNTFLNTQLPPLTWQPDFPDFARPRTPNVNIGWYSFVNTSSGFAPLGSWYPEYPDFVYGKKTPASHLASTLVNVDYVPKLGWLSEYPDFVPNKRGINVINTGPMFTNVDYVPKLEWLAKFPDRVVVPQTLSAALRQSQGTINTLLSVVPLLSWHPSYPDLITPDPRWDGWFAFVNTTTQQVKLDWLPVYPDFTQRLKVAAEGQTVETLGNIAPVIFQARFAEHIQRALFLKTLELPLPNTLTRIYGIHQSDVVIASAIKVAIADMRANPWTLDYVFASLPQDPITWKEYGEKSVQAAKDWFLKTDIAVMVTPTANELKAPCISVMLKESTEATNEATLGDVHSEPIEDNDMSWPALCSPFTPASYVPATGVVTLQTAPEGFYLAPGMFIIDKKGQAYEIQDVTDSLTFSISADSVPDLRDCVFKSSRPNFKVSVESSSFREVYSVGVHAGAEPVYCTWLHSIVLFALLRYKQVLLEARGFERSTVSSTDFDRNPTFETETVYSRYINVSGYVRQYWPKNVSIKTDAVIPFEIKVSGQDADVKVGDGADELLWIGNKDMLDPKKRR